MRLTESQLKQIIKQEIRKALNENSSMEEGAIDWLKDKFRSQDKLAGMITDQLEQYLNLPGIKEIKGKGLFKDRKSTRLNSSH